MMLGGAMMDARTVKLIERRIQGHQRINSRIPHLAGGKLADPACGHHPSGRGCQLVAGCRARQDPLPQSVDVGLDVHAKKTSTLVLQVQPQKHEVLAHANYMDTNTRKIVAANVARLRKDRAMNQTDLGNRAGVGQTTVSSIENPEGKSPTLETLSAIAKALHVPEWTLLVDGSALDSTQLKSLDHLVHVYTDLPDAGKTQVQRVAEAEERYAKAG